MKQRTTLAVGITVTAALFLGACTDAQDDTDPGTTTETVATTTTGADGTATTTTTATTERDEQATGEDPVFGAIAAVLDRHADGIIVDIDREDDRDTYDIDVVVGDEVIELEVDADGTVREDEREGEDEDVARAQAATVTAEAAIRDALNQHPDGFLDEAQLEDEDGNLIWEIDLDDADRNDLAELSLPAN